MTKQSQNRPNIAELLQKATPETKRIQVDLGPEAGVVEIVMPTLKQQGEITRLNTIQPDPDDPGATPKARTPEECLINAVISQTVYPGTDERVFNHDAHASWMFNELPRNTEWWVKLSTAASDFLFQLDFKAKKKNSSATGSDT